MWWPSLILASLLGPLVTSALPQGGRSQILKEIYFYFSIYIYIYLYFILFLGDIVGLELFEIFFRVIWVLGERPTCLWKISKFGISKLFGSEFAPFLAKQVQSLTFLEGSLVLVDKPTKLKVSSECST